MTVAAAIAVILPEHGAMATEACTRGPAESVGPTPQGATLKGRGPMPVRKSSCSIEVSWLSPLAFIALVVRAHCSTTLTPSPSSSSTGLGQAQLPRDECRAHV